MRAACSIAVIAALVACGDDPAGPRPNDPEVPRDDLQLLIERYSRAGERSFYTIALDGSFFAPFPAPDDARQLIPSPDGEVIAYLREHDDLVHLWLMDRHGILRQPVLDGEIVVNSVSWNPDRTHLVIQYNTLTVADNIAVVRADGAEFTDLTPDPLPGVWSDRTPVWSPDGTRIAFISNRTGTNRLWIMGADGSDPDQVLETVAGTEDTPAWSADGAWIAVRASHEGAGEGIAIVHPDGTGLRVFEIDDARNPAWTPAGHILYSARLSNLDYELFQLDPGTGESERITEHTDDDFRAVPFPHVAPSRPWLAFATPALYTTGRPDPPGIAAGDLNGNGLPDLVLLAPAMEEVRYLRGIGNGAFEAVGSVIGPPLQREGVIADVSRDRIGDIIVSSDDQLTIWRGSPGGPGLSTAHEVPGEIRGLVTADLDRDGWSDLVSIYAPTPASFRFYVHGTNPDGELVAIVDGEGMDVAGAGRACAADVTGEGTTDVVAVTTTPTASAVLLPGHGDITFDIPLVAAVGLPIDDETVPVCADFDGDRHADMALLRPGPTGGLSVLRWTGSAFGPPVSLGVRGSAMAAADFDRDGDVDLIIAGGPDQNRLSFLRNRGDGRFAGAIPIATVGAPIRLVAADLDDDTWVDIAAAGENGAISVLLNRRR